MLSLGTFYDRGPSIKGLSELEHRGSGWLSVTKYALPHTGLARNQVFGGEDLRMHQVVDVDVIVKRTWETNGHRRASPW